MCNSVSWVFQYASEAVERCFLLTGGWGFNGLLKALQVSYRGVKQIVKELCVLMYKYETLQDYRACPRECA